MPTMLLLHVPLHLPSLRRSAACTTLGLALLLGGPLAAGGLGAQQQVDRGWRLERDGVVRVHNYWGSTRVVGWDRDSVAVTGTADAGLQFRGGGGASGVKMFVEGQETDRGGAAALLIRIPATARVWVKSAGASVEVSGVRGGVDVTTVGGDIRVTGSPRELSAESMQGAIELNVTSPWVRARTAGGAIVLRGESEDVAATTVSGRLVAEASGIRRGRLESVSGDLRFAGTLERDGTLVAETHSGAVELALPADIGADFAIQTVAAPIENGLTSRRALASRQRGGEELVFSTREGGAQVTVRSFKGKVRLVKR